MTGLIQSAASYAAQKHSSQKRKYTGRPYIEHPGRVAARLTRMNLDDDIIAAAWLHDVLEDCNVSFNDLRNLFPLATCNLVHELTNPSKKYPHDSRDVRKKMDREHIRNATPYARMIKMADRIDNLRELDPAQPFASLYLHESQELLRRMPPTNTELEHEFDQTLKDLQDAVINAEHPSTCLEDALHTWITNALGGGPELLNDNNRDHYSITTNLLSLMEIAGPGWQKVAERVKNSKKLAPRIPHGPAPTTVGPGDAVILST